ncbi:hypothetical protein [Tardiphaga sp.]|jgi:hypothetical protein|uniref:hypothetical protein n=1 Tax=Tardiphaga sp. TaxID=1926292 RepID=UPI0037DA088B
MRCLAFACLFATATTLPATLKAESASWKPVQGEWHQIASNAGTCADCRILVANNGADFTVKSNNGWSATVRQSFSQGKTFIAGKGSWDQTSGAYGGKPFFLNLGLKGDQLLMLMTVPGRDGTLQNIQAIFERTAISGRT